MLLKSVFEDFADGGGAVGAAEGDHVDAGGVTLHVEAALIAVNGSEIASFGIIKVNFGYGAVGLPCQHIALHRHLGIRLEHLGRI